MNEVLLSSGQIVLPSHFLCAASCVRLWINVSVKKSFTVEGHPTAVLICFAHKQGDCVTWSLLIALKNWKKNWNERTELQIKWMSWGFRGKQFVCGRDVQSAPWKASGMWSRVVDRDNGSSQKTETLSLSINHGPKDIPRHCLRLLSHHFPTSRHVLGKPKSQNRCLKKINK